MIDKNKIKSAAQGYCDATYGTLNTNPFIAEAFRKGANWAINEFLKDLWHPIEEEPTIVGEEIVLEVFVNNKHHTIVQNYMVGENPTFRSPYETIRWITNWNTLLNPRDEVIIKRWFYLKDLLTKQKSNERA